MFIDVAKVTVIAGTGGNGCASFHRTRSNPRGGPDGGNGGNGGNVIIRADRNLATLCDFFYQPRYRGGSGKHGSSNNKHGANGDDVILRVPLGTLVRDTESGELLADLVEEDQEIVVAKGGRGGFGNVHYKSSTNRAPRLAQPGNEGEQHVLAFELKLMADIALVGYPNAGKSTLISATTHAHAKIASYPFTTRQPILGLLELPDFRRAVIADIPGLIKGAHRNVGLGHAFLRHVERCSMLLVILDMAGVDQRDPGDDYAVLLNELVQYNPELVQRPRLVVANKMDLPAAADNLSAFKASHPDVEIISVSALEGIGLDVLLDRLEIFLTANAHLSAGEDRE